MWFAGATRRTEDRAGMSDLTTSVSPGSPRTPRRRRWPWGIAAAVVSVAFVLVWFQPQKLFIDDRVDEALPNGAAAAGPASPPPSVAGQSPPEGGAKPAEVSRGEFVSLDHGTTGVARILEIGDGTRVLRFEGLDTDNGPDLFVYLTANRAGGEEGAFDADFVNLGRLKGNQGDQNYELSADVDLGRYTTVVIWCDRFNSAFGAAELA